jgi:hypothetical protein
MRSLASFIALSVAITPAISKIYTKPTDIGTMVFDYIVVGGIYYAIISFSRLI